MEQVIEVNNSRKKKMAQKVIDFCGGSVAGLTIGVLGLTFKPNTDDMRDAPSLDIVPALQAAGADVLVVITEWHEFRGLDPRRLKETMRQPRIVDLRNIFDPGEMRSLGFAYEGAGRLAGLSP